MPNVRSSSFSVEALESRILLSATPLDAPVADPMDSPETLCIPIWEESELEQQGLENFADNEETANLFEGASALAPASFASTDFEALSIASYGDGETVEGSIFRSGFTVIETGATHIFRATSGSIFFSGPGAIDGTAPVETQENVHFISAGSVTIDGQIGGGSEIHDLTISANSNIFFGGSIYLTGNLIIEKGAQVTFNRDVIVEGNIIIGDPAAPGDIAGVTFGANSIVNAGGRIEIHTLGSAEFHNLVTASTAEVAAANLYFERSVRIHGESVDAVALSLTASNLLTFKSALEIGQGDAILTANRVSFDGGFGSIQTTETASSLTIRPFTTSRPIGIGDPSGGDFNRLQISHIELNAINTGFREVIIGDLQAGSGELRVGNIGLAQTTAIAQIQNPVTFVGGSVLVESRIDIDVLASHLRLVARTGNITVDGGINQSVTERNPWVRLEAAGNILINRPIFALDRISLTAGYFGGAGSVTVNSTGANSGHLFTTSSAISATERRIEISAGAAGGNITIADEAGQTTLWAAGTGSSIVMQAPAGTIAQSGGLLRAETLAMRASGPIDIAQADIQRVGQVTIGGAALQSGMGEIIEGVEITGPGSLNLSVQDALTIDSITAVQGGITVGSGGDLRIGQISSVSGDIFLQADGAIVDDLAGVGVVNLATLGNATLVAANGIGGAGSADLDTDLGSLTAITGSGDIVVHDRSALLIMGELTTQSENGSIAVTVDTGNLTVNAPVSAHGSGNLFLQAASGILVINASLGSSVGHLTLRGDQGIELLENSAVTTGEEGTLFLDAANGGIDMHGTATVMTAGSTIRAEADGDIVLGNLTGDKVSVVSGNGSIVNATGSVVNVTATELRMEAAEAIGNSGRHLSVKVDRIAAIAGGTSGVDQGIFLSQSGQVTVTQVAPVVVQAFGADGVLNSFEDAVDLSNLTAGNDGNIILVNDEGTVRLEDGNGDGTSVLAVGSGNIRIETGGDGSELLVDADVISDTGHITLISYGPLAIGPDAGVYTSGAGSILARASGGDLTMASTAGVTASGGAIHLSALATVIVGQVEADDVAVIAEEGSILSALGAPTNFIATGLRLEADQAVGAEVRFLLTTAAFMTVLARGKDEKGVYLVESGDMTVGTAGYSGSEFLSDGTTVLVEVALQAGVTSENDGVIHLVAGGTMTIADGVQIDSGSGEIRLSAEGDVRLSAVSSASADIFVSSQAGAILDNTVSEAPNLATTGTIHLVAATGIGGIGAADLNTEAGSITAWNRLAGLIVIRDVNDLTLSDQTELTGGGVRNDAPGGSVLIETTGGSLTVNGPVFAGTGGKILLDAAGGDFALTAQSGVTTENGAISVLAAGSITVGATVVALTGGTLDLEAGGGIAILSTGMLRSANADIRIRAGSDVSLTGVNAGTANVHVSALSGAITDGGNDITDILAAGLRLFAFSGIGESSPLDIDVNTIAARAVSGSIHLSEKNDITIGTIPVVSVERVLADNTTATAADAAPVSDLIAESAGDVSLVSETGSITIEDGISANGFGVISNGGNITLQSATVVVQKADISTTGAAGISVTALGGSVTMSDGIRTISQNGDITYNASGSVYLSVIESVNGNLAIDSGDSISDNTAAETPNLLTAGHAALTAVNGIGNFGVADIDTAVGSISAINESSGRIVIEGLHGLTVAGDGVETGGADGDIILTSQTGDVTIDAIVSAHGNGVVLLAAMAPGAGVEASKAISSYAGHISVIAAGEIHLKEGASLLSGGEGTVTFRAQTGSVAFDGPVLVDAGSGDVRVEGYVNVLLGSIQTTGNVIVSATTGSILNNIDSEPHLNVIASGTRLNAAIGVGSLGAFVKAVTTNITVLSARATSGGINLDDSADVTVGDVTVLTQRVNVDGTISPETESVQSDVVTTGGNGSIVVRAESQILLTDGTGSANNIAVQAHGSGNIFLQARTGAAGLTAQADVRTGSGNVTLDSYGTVLFTPGANISTSASGTINLDVSQGSIVMDDTTRFLTGIGDIRLAAFNDVGVGNISTAGNVAVIALIGSILDNGDTRIDISANGLILNAGTGVGTLGSGANAIETTVQTLSARAGSGGINIRETNNLSISDVTVSVNRVTEDGSTVVLTEGTQADVRTLDGNGSIVLRLSNGSFILERGSASTDDFAVAAHGTGNVLIQTLGVFTDIIANGGISSQLGNISLSSSLQIFFANSSEVRTGANGTIDVVTLSGFLSMEDGALMTTEAGDIRLLALGDILLGGIRSDANVSIISEFASILDNGDTDVDVVATGLRLWAHTNVGILVPVGVAGGPNPLNTEVSLLTAHASVGDINIVQQTSVTVDGVSVTVNRVNADGTTSPLTDATQSDLRTFAQNGSIVLRSTDGNIVLNDGATLDNTAVFVHGNGNILLEAGIGILANASMVSGAGHITVLAAESVEFTATAGLHTGDSGTIHLTAQAGDLVQSGNSRFTAVNGDIRLFAGHSIHLGEVETNAKVSLLAENGSIIDSGNLAGGEDVIADQLRVVAGTGIGEPAAHLITRVNILAARAGSGGIFLRNTAALIITSTTGATVQRVNADNTLTGIGDDTLSDVATISGNGSIVLETNGGSLTLNDGSAPADNIAIAAHGAGNIRLHAMETGSDLFVNADILSATGHITLMGARDLTLNENVNITTASPGTILLDALTGSLTIAGTATISGTAIRLASAADIIVGNLVADDISIVSRLGSILNASGSTKNATAINLRLEAAQAIATVDRYFTTAVSTITASAGGDSDKGIYINEDSAIVVSAVEVTVLEVNPDATATPLTDDVQSGLVTGNDGHVILMTVDGSIVTEEMIRADGSGSILLDARGPENDLLINGEVASTTGQITLKAANNLELGSNSHLTTGEPGTISLTAEAGSLTMQGGLRISAADTSLRLQAFGNIFLGDLVALHVTILSATGSIWNAQGSTTNVTATTLRLEAGQAIGAPDRHLTTAVSRIAAAANGSGSTGIYLTESNSITVATVDPIVVIEFESDTTTTQVTDSVLSGLVTNNHGDIVLFTLDGAIIVEDGINNDNVAVGAAGTGSILLEARGAAGNLDINANIFSETGHITIKADADLTMASDVAITTSASGTVSLDARGGALTMAGTSNITADDSALRLAAAEEILVANLTATDVSILSRAGSILNADGSTKNVTATNLRLEAGDAIGAANRHFTTVVSAITARADGGANHGIYITEDTAINIASLSVTVLDFNPNATTTSVLDEEQGGLVTGNDGNIVLVALNGAIEADQIVSADGSGNILLEARSLGSDLTVRADIQSVSGQITLNAINDIAITGGAHIATAAPGTISLKAENGAITMNGAARITAADGSLRLHALNDITIGNLAADHVSILSVTASILNAADSTRNVNATNLRLEAGQAIGDANRHLSTEVASLTAIAKGNGGTGLYITEATHVTVTTVSVTVTRFHSDASTTEVTDAGQSDFVTLNNGNIILVALDGDITLTDGDNADNTAVRAEGAGNILIDARGSGTVITHADVLSDSGQITLKADQDILVGADVNIATAITGSISFDARTGSLTMAGNANVTATDSSLRLAALGDVLVGNLVATHVSIVSLNGAILNSTDSTMNVTGTNLRLEAGQAIATPDRHLTTLVSNIAAFAVGADGNGIYVTNAAALTVTTLSVTVTDFNSDATASVVTDSDQSGVITENSGNIVLVTLDGTIVIDDFVSADASGNILIHAGNTLSDLILNADVLSEFGQITLEADRGIALAEGVNVVTSASGTVSLTAGNGDITMDGSANIIATGSSLRLAAANDIFLGNLAAENVSIVAIDGSVLNASVSTKNVVATNLRLEAARAIGTADRHLTTRVNNVTGLAGGTAVSGIYLSEDTHITVTSLSVTVTHFLTDATTIDVTDASQSGLVTGNFGNIVLVTNSGGITVHEVVSADGGGSVLLDARGGRNMLTLNADVTSGTGHVTLKAPAGITLTAAINVATASPGTISIDAGSLTMDGAANVTAVNSGLRISAESQIILGNLAAADVSIISNGGRIVNAPGSMMNVSATNLRLSAEQHIGAAERHVTTTVDQLTAFAGGQGTGGIYLTEANHVTVIGVAVTVTELNADATTTEVTDVAQSDLVAEMHGNIVLVALDGSVTLDDGPNADGTAVRAVGIGNILIEAQGIGGDLIVNADILGSNGNITLKAASDLGIGSGANITTSAIGTVSLDAIHGSLTMAGSATITADNSSLRLAASGDLVVGNLVATNVSLLSRTASIVNAADSIRNVAANNLRIEAAQAIGTPVRHLSISVSNLTAFAEGSLDNGIYLTAENIVTITVATLGVTVHDFNADATVSAVIDSAQSGLVTSNGGNIVLVAVDGSIITNQPTIANGAGNILIDARGLESFLSINTGITSGTGNIFLRSANGITVADNVDITTSAPGTITLNAEGGALIMQGSASIIAVNSGVHLHALTAIRVGNLTAANVSLISFSGSIFNAAGSNTNVTATNLRLQANQGIGAPERHLTISVDTVTAHAAGFGERGIYITEDDGSIVGSVGVTVTLFHSNGTNKVVTDPVQSGLVAGNDGDIVLVALEGSITINDGVHAVGAGNILLDTRGTGSELTLNATLISDSGNITLRSNAGMHLNAAARITTVGGTLDVEAGASITFADDALIHTNGGNARLIAGVDIVVGGIAAGTGKVSLIATAGSILDGGNTHREITAASARLIAGHGIGLPGNGLDVRIGTLTALAGEGGISLTEADGLTVDSVMVTVNRVGQDGQLTDLTDSAQSDLVTTGDLALISGGDLILHDGGNDNGISVSAAGNILFDVTGSLTANADLTSLGGHVSLLVIGPIEFATGADLTTGGGTLDLDSGAAIRFADGAQAISHGGNIRFLAATDITLGKIDAADGKVSLIATDGSILDRGDLHLEIIAAAARLFAGVGIGEPTNPLDLDVALVTAHSGLGGISLSFVGNVTLGTVSVAVNRVAADFTTSQIIDPAQSGFATTGSLALRFGGDLTLDTEMTAVGNLLLDVGGALIANHNIRSTGGDITFIAGDSIKISAGVEVTTAGGTIDFEAGSWIQFINTARASTVGGNVRFLAADDITLGGIDAAEGKVSLIATSGSVLDGGDADTDIIASAVRLWAGHGIGQPTNSLDIEVATLTVHSGIGGISLNQSGDLVIDAVSVTVNRVGAEFEVSAILDDELADLVTAGSLALTVGGDLTLQSPTEAVRVTDNLLLDLEGNLHAYGTLFAGGHISILATGTINFDGVANLETSGGTIDFEAGGSMLFADPSLVSSAGGNIRFLAANDIVLAGLNAGTGAVSLTATSGAILDGGDTHLDIIASAVRLVAGLAIGEATDSLEIHVDLLTARSGNGGISLNELDGLFVGAVAVTVNRVADDFSVSEVLDIAHAGVETTGSLALASGGSVILDAPVEAGDHIFFGVTGALTANSLLNTIGGHVSLLVSGSIGFTSGATFSTDGGTVDLQSGASIHFADTASIVTGGGNIRLLTADDITLGGIDAGSGKVSLIATAGSILDGGDHYTDIVAAEARLVAGLGIGEVGNALDINVGVLTAHAGSAGIRINEADGLVVDAVTVIVNRVASTFTLMEILDEKQADLVTTGSLALISGGDVTLNVVLPDFIPAPGGDPVPFIGNDVVKVDGNVLIDVRGILTVNARMSIGGHASLIASGVINVNVFGLISTIGGTLDLESGASILFAQFAGLVTGGENVRLVAAGDVALGSIHAGEGDVSVTATSGSILNSRDDLVRIEGLVGPSVNITAASARLFAGTAIGAETHPLEINATVLSAHNGDEGIYVSEADGFTIGKVAVEVNRVGADFQVSAIADSVQSGLATSGFLVLSSGGSILTAASSYLDLVATRAVLTAVIGIGEAGKPLDINVEALVSDAGIGGISLKDANGLSIEGLNTTGGLAVTSAGDVTLDGAISADGNVLFNVTGHLAARFGVISNGHVSLIATGNLDFLTGSHVVLDGDTLDIMAGGSITFAPTASANTSGGNVRMSAANDITIGRLDAGAGTISLTAVSGFIRESGSVETAITGTGVRLLSGMGIGSEGNPLSIRAALITALTESGGIYLDVRGATSVAPVGVTVKRVAADFSLSDGVDAAQNGLVASSGSILVKADSNVSLKGAVHASGSVGLHATGWLRHSWTGASPVISAGTHLEIVAGSGVGATGAGTVSVSASTLGLKNTGAGSVHLRTAETISVTSASLAGAGSLFFNQEAGTLHIPTVVSVTAGDLNVLVRDHLHLENASLTAGGSIDILTGTLTIASTPILSESGLLELRVAGDLILEDASPLRSAAGDLRLRTGSDLVVGRVSAAGLVHFVAAGDITTSAPGQVEKGLFGDHLRLRSGGSIGTAEAPMMTDGNRLDVDAGGNVHLRHAGGLSIGRFGLKIETAPGEEFVIEIEGGVVHSAGGGIVDRGQGTLVLQSAREITIGSLVRSEGGNIRIEATRILSGFDSEVARLEAPTGRVTLIAQTGIGSTGGGAIHFSAPWIEASTVTGPIQLNGLQSTTVTGAGVLALRGSETVTLNLRHGDLTLESSVRHLGSGAVGVTSAEGAIRMERNARITTTTGALSVKALTEVVLSRVESGRGLIRLDSMTGSILPLRGYPSAHLVATVAPQINVASIVDLRITADKVIVNGIEIFRRAAPVITLYLVF